MNFIHIAGHLGADPETRVTPGGQKVTNFRVACNLRRGKEDITVWYRVTVWGDRWDKMMPYLKKGSSVMIGGELGKPEIYNDRSGQPQVSLEITAEYIRFSPFGKGMGGDQQSRQGTAPQPATSGYGDSGYDMGDFGQAGVSAGVGQGHQTAEDDLPF